MKSLISFINEAFNKTNINDVDIPTLVMTILQLSKNKTPKNLVNMILLNTIGNSYEVKNYDELCKLIEEISRYYETNKENLNPENDNKSMTKVDTISKQMMDMIDNFVKKLKSSYSGKVSEGNMSKDQLNDLKEMLLMISGADTKSVVSNIIKYEIGKKYKGHDLDIQNIVFKYYKQVDSINKQLSKLINTNDRTFEKEFNILVNDKKELIDKLVDELQ